MLSSTNTDQNNTEDEYIILSKKLQDAKDVIDGSTKKKQKRKRIRFSRTEKLVQKVDEVFAWNFLNPQGQTFTANTQRLSIKTISNFSDDVR